MWRAAPRMSLSLIGPAEPGDGASTEVGDAPSSGSRFGVDTTGGSHGPISAAPDPAARVNDAATKTVMTTIVTVSGSACERVARGCARRTRRTFVRARAGRPIMAIPPSATTADPPRQASRPQKWGVVRSGRPALPAAAFLRRCRGTAAGRPCRGVEELRCLTCERDKDRLAVRRESDTPVPRCPCRTDDRRGCPGDSASAGAIMVCPADAVPLRPRRTWEPSGECSRPASPYADGSNLNSRSTLVAMST